MTDPSGFGAAARRVFELYVRVVRMLTLALLVVSGVSILALMALVTIDVVLRAAGHPITGALDIVQILGALAIACALPYTTAVKGHVAIEYFFLKLRRRGRIVVDTLARLIAIALFAFLSWESAQYGISMKQNNQLSPTIQLPMFWVPLVIAFSCAVVTLVIVHNLLRPGKEMIKP